jgi:hypothetical protein
MTGDMDVTIGGVTTMLKVADLGFPSIRGYGQFMTKRQALLLRAFAVWTVYVWVTRMWNIWHDHTKGHGAGFKAVHSALAVISVAFAIAAWRVVTVVQARRGAKGAGKGAANAPDVEATPTKTGS